MNLLSVHLSISKKLNFTITLFFLALSFFVHAQNPTVINDSLIINNRVYAKEKLIVDQEAKFKQDIKVLGTARMFGDLKVDGDLRVDGNTKLNGNVKMEYLDSIVTIDSSITFLVMLPNGQLNKAPVGVLLDQIYEPALCIPGDISNPTWSNGLNKIFSPCPQVNVGIGNSAPAHKLDVSGTSYARSFLAGNSTASITALINAFANSSSPDLIKLGVKTGSLPETVRFKISGTGTVSMYNYGGHSLIAYDDAGAKILQLENNGLLRTREVRVDETNWPDYVFDKNYKLPKLKDLAKYIETNHHLPGVPSAAEIESDGLNLGDMQNIHMQKIEELTLYMIEMEKRIEALEKENEELKKSR